MKTLASLLGSVLFQARILRIVVPLALALTATSALALENAYRWYNNPNQGIQASIETGDPTLRDNPSGKWSYMRVFVQRIISGNVYYAEIGWYKDATGHKVFWTYRRTNGTVQSDFLSGSTPGVGLYYGYQVKRTASNTWSFYFNQHAACYGRSWLGHSR